MRGSRLTLAAAALTVIAACGGQPAATRGSAATAPAAPVATSVPGPAAPSPATIDPSAAATRLVIDKIGVNALVESVGQDRTGAMDIPAHPMDVGWFKQGPVPGQAGDAVIDGHLDWYGVPHAVFWSLNKLVLGDQVKVVAANGDTIRFVVRDIHSYPYTAHPPGLFLAGGDPQISLITCDGTYSGKVYSDRLVVTALRVV